MCQCCRSSVPIPNWLRQHWQLAALAMATPSHWQGFRIGDSSPVARPSAGGAPVVPFPVALRPFEGVVRSVEGTCGEALRGAEAGGFRVSARPADGKRCFPSLTSCAQGPRKCGRFRAPEKHEIFFKKPLASQTPF